MTYVYYGTSGDGHGGVQAFGATASDALGNCRRKAEQYLQNRPEAGPLAAWTFQPSPRNREARLRGEPIALNFARSADAAMQSSLYLLALGWGWAAGEADRWTAVRSAR